MRLTKIIYKELEMLGFLRTMVTNIKEIPNKNGIYLYRFKYSNKSYVLKYFLHEKDRREIKNYNTLRQLNEPTIKVVGSTDKSILFEDLENNKEYRLGIKEDLCDIETARAIAKLYNNFLI